MVVSVEEVASSLVREFLSRKGLKRTIACMDEESPRTAASISNRSDLRRVLQVEGLNSHNKALNSPLKTLLEMIVKSHIEGPTDDLVSLQGDPLHTSRSRANLNTLTHGDGSNPQYHTEEVPKTHLNQRSVRQDNGSLRDTPVSGSPSPRQSSPPDEDSDPAKQQPSGAYLRDNVSYPRRETAANESAVKNRANRSRRGVLGGPIANTPQDPHKRRPSTRAGLPPSAGGRESGPSEHPGLSKGSARRTPRGGSPPDPGESSAAGLLRDRQRGRGPAEGRGSPGTHDGVQGRRPKPSTDLTMESSQSSEMVLDDFDYDEDFQDVSRVSLSQMDLSQVSLQPGSLPQHSHKSSRMDVQTATALKELLLGSGSRCFSPEWRNQGFGFSETPDLRYGIVQRKGGPCGVLASVQACLLQKLLFDDPNPAGEELGRLRPSDGVRRRCLVLAVSEVLWRAGEHKTATLAITSGRSHFVPSGHYKSEGLLEKVTCFTADNLNALQWLLEEHIQQFESGSFGCLLFCVSAVLSRSIAKVREDMDVSSNTLIGAHGYCTQELVNLLLCGQAASNVFDGQVQLDSTLLKGVTQPCNIGLLSLFEHHNICQVGSHLKTPLFPIWVVCSESHFSTLFGLQRELATNQDGRSRGPREFDLYYYDGLANQQQEIRLSVSVGLAAAFREDNDPELTPPLEQCIRTKWKDAIVRWNDTEPIL
ncbi:probable ubiquitin carboxyl-terminal hydrolase MINDY-4 [Gadus macrocephalus]|uniref:probable ubiquitin carboxyl-terminal hydrolase MINDY-4 n=1 Tax=Gadus macrocephalus TaxID=80720 RepID=UPI0028CB5337|nr:probable ubiquitin carboxyl-terminal hydrolase MINDY-4 [Gadus macrocephalus]